MKMNRMSAVVFLGAIATLPVRAAVETRLPADYGAVRLTGPVGDRLDLMVQNHVCNKDAEYLAECFRCRSETCLWQTEFWGKFMHGACPLFAMCRDERLRSSIEKSTVAVIAAQDEDGYIGNYALTHRFASRTWDVWGCKYVMMGLLHHYDLTGERKSLEAALRLCRYVAGQVGPGSKMPISMTGSYSGMASCSILEPVVWLYMRTKEKDVLDFADFIVREMTDAENGPRLVDLALKGVPVAERSRLPPKATRIWDGVQTNRGKAYEMMSCYQGLLEYYQMTGRKDLLSAAVASADDILSEEVNLAGGAASCEHWYHGARHQHEPYPHMQETCVTITWMRLCEKLLALTGDVKYADAFERTFYNAYLAALNRSGEGFAAYTPLSGARSPGNVHCRMHTNCCNENGPRGFVAFLRSVVQAKGDEVYLNYFVSSRAKIAVPATGDIAEFEIYTLYPKTGSVDIRFRNRKPMSFSFAVRVPGWAKDVKMKVNDKAVDVDVAGTWVAQTRVWKEGDCVSLDFELPLDVHRIGDSVAFTRGPILLARDTRF